MNACCMLCNSSTNNELKYGELLTAENVTVHYFCLLFAPALITRGTPEEGIRGFLIEDILKECKRVKKIRCGYCRKANANLGCCVEQCKQAYHLPCGLKNRISTEFAQNFPTFCFRHRRFVQKEKPKLDENCGICMERVRSCLVNSILMPCCKNYWVHQSCLQKYAMTSGVHFKCPLCNNKTECHELLPRLGIYIPEKDADWEFDNEALEELSNQAEKRCESSNCSNYISYSECPSMWIFCSSCGSNAVHTSCFSEAFKGAEFNCKSCTTILENLKDSKRNNLMAKTKTLSMVNPIVEPLVEPSSTTDPKQISGQDFSEDSSLSSPKKVESSQKASSKRISKRPQFLSWFSDDEQEYSEDEDFALTEYNTRNPMKKRKVSVK